MPRSCAKPNGYFEQIVQLKADKEAEKTPGTTRREGNLWQHHDSNDNLIVNVFFFFSSDFVGGCGLGVSAFLPAAQSCQVSWHQCCTRRLGWYTVRFEKVRCRAAEQCNGSCTTWALEPLRQCTRPMRKQQSWGVRTRLAGVCLEIQWSLLRNAIRFQSDTIEQKQTEQREVLHIARVLNCNG